MHCRTNKKTNKNETNENRQTANDAEKTPTVKISISTNKTCFCSATSQSAKFKKRAKATAQAQQNSSHHSGSSTLSLRVPPPLRAILPGGFVIVIVVHLPLLPPLHGIVSQLVSFSASRRRGIMDPPVQERAKELLRKERDGILVVTVVVLVLFDSGLIEAFAGDIEHPKNATQVRRASLILSASHKDGTLTTTDMSAWMRKFLR